MDTKACISLVILALVLAGPDTRAAAFTGIDAAAAVMPTSSSSSSSSRIKLGDGVASELLDSTTVDLKGHRRVLAGGGISAGSLNSNKAACTRTCPARGGPYTGRPCLRRYQCR
ncbi:hypothetical protein CFC21_050185 [Triticum aestivum]|uniref:Uncharacterized protein n=2 Tax=Triticum aestivum TaxID=4565 RepID=A0A9R1G3J0_WHEAT|nr:uncharacterized protein LOC123075692 [Triticum aestivum]KAF7040264.1 hypothetical protein CFC21_050177 [Triticum aestivum]KAF7040272.1 hypothetical protein CFC21_050185 [Triticum aestivum]